VNLNSYAREQDPLSLLVINSFFANMSSTLSHLYTFFLFLQKSLSFVAGLFHSFFDLFTRAGRTTESDAQGTEVQARFTVVSSRRPKESKPLVLPQNVALRQWLEDVKRRITEMTPSQFVSSYMNSANSSDPELGHCNVVNLWDSLPLFHPLSDRLQSAAPWASPSSYVLTKYSPRSVPGSSWLSVCDAQGHSDKKSLPHDADLSVSPPSASLAGAVWTSSPLSLSPIRLDCSYSPFAGENRSYFAPYFSGSPSVVLANNVLDFSIYPSSLHANVGCSIVSDASEEHQEQKKPRLAIEAPTVIYDPAILLTLHPDYSARTLQHGEPNLQTLNLSVSPASPISLACEWSPSGLLVSPVRGTSSLSEPHCTISLRDLSALAELGGIHLDSVLQGSVVHAEGLIPETMSDVLGCSTTRE
jgi:hypothetical protein